MNSRWPWQFESELVRLGLEPVRARRLREETLGQAGESGDDPGLLFGPAHLYARHLISELFTPPVPAFTRPTPGGHPGDAPAVGPVILDLSGICKHYRRRTVLTEVNLVVRAGEVAAVVGANGSGKSTLLRICAGLVRPSAGTVHRCARVGFVPQDGGTVGGLTAAEHFVLFGAADGVSRRRARSTGEHLAARLHWRPRREQLVGELSGGTRQKLNLLLGELAAPGLLLLDEPYQGFDQGSYLNFWHQVTAWRDAGTAVVVVTHLLHELENVDQVLDLGCAEPGPARPPRRGEPSR